MACACLAAAPRHAAAEIKNRLLLLDGRERVGDRLDCPQPRVVVEHVVLRARIGGAAGFVSGRGLRRRGVERDAVHRGEPAQRLLHRLVVGREVGEHVERRVDRGHGDEVRARHLVVHVVHGGLPGAVELVGLHRAQIEEQHDQTAAREVSEEKPF